MVGWVLGSWASFISPPRLAEWARKCLVHYHVLDVLPRSLPNKMPKTQSVTCANESKSGEKALFRRARKDLNT
eukprot:1382066-Amorphochlora_amoeboformis.AAC.1